MEKTLILFFLLFTVLLFPQQKMYIHQGNKALGIPVSGLGSLSFSDNRLNFLAGSNAVQISLDDIDSLSFTDNSDTVYISYNGNSVSIINPLAYENVTVSAEGAYVTVTSASETKDLNFKISGESTEGMFKIYSGKRFNLVFNGLSLTNSNGPAVNIQSGNKVSVTLADGTVNSITDGSIYADTLVNSSNETEDQNAAFFSKGEMVFGGTGSLTINGMGADKHGLFSKDEIEINSGLINISSASKDGIHGDGIIITDGNVNVTSAGDGIDGDESIVKLSGGSLTIASSSSGAEAITCDSTLEISGGTINITVSGEQSKGIKSGQVMTLSGGDITVNTSGNAALEVYGSGYDPSYCTAIKCDTVIDITGSNIIITSTGMGGKGISSDNNINISAGNINIKTSGGGTTYKNSTGVTDIYNAACITADAAVNILGGSVTISSSGAAGKGISSDGTLTIGDANNIPVVNITTTGSKVTISGSGQNKEYAEAKAISCNGAVVVNNGTVTISSADDGIKSEVSVTINNGTVSINKSTEGIESPLITINSGDVGITSSDDGFNATKGSGGESNDGSYLYINGGNVHVSTTTGDGLDSNGNIVMTGGTVVVHGPTSNPEVGMDYNGTFNISGGLLVVTGPNSGNMIQAASTTSSQYSVKATSASQVAASTLFHVQDSNGTELFTFKPDKNFYYVVFSSPELKSGSSYSIYTGGSDSGTNNYGLFSGGTYSGGSFKKTFTISSKVTSVQF